ncbi:HlyD family efflux transporter periplasmic adaptor subunit [Pseudoalteromonas sp. SR44-5]|uniref:efflux RND transporter periplasmic adaptor subunit n=1 Tax=unclassified Pseudoalteromonas TaxID=194690 RepID=UPI0016030976|nr:MULTISPECIES: HlyD family efflux transporter periplasmic adaptor subunit [unclassified Pseudoalteromonas]MBB1331860.1 HlyD family efflux transporter periplasmic adaptor subunit [Pseudoalteromonas sp. SR41-6]MBB1340912.1 HlyD family efflux transporter periplasmic adaptor subunit [Pseudoalteromonas sp. SR45-6]MBB1366010.1 HlyD family efflux transporter periplasmic adaptor subunit [Pseudoalteromonas sp. SR44-5]MBB1417102.1 HlyD family efflux transporter periplasmic adaptor subunit [Pseudoaltero
MNHNVLCIILSMLLLTACNDDEQQHYLVKKSDIAITVNANGELESSTSAIIAPPSVARMWQYQIKTMLAENTQVKKGQVVVSFDDKQVRDKLIDKQSSLERAKKQLENAQNKELIKEQELTLSVAEMKMNYDKAKRKAEIVDQSRSEVERKKSQIDFTIANNDLTLAKSKQTFQQQSKELNLKMVQSKVARLQSEVDEYLQDIERLKVKAPIDGLVIYKTNYEGEKSSIGESVQFGQPVIELAVLKNMQVKAQIDEPDSGKIAPGQTVKITIDGSSELVVSGKIKSLGRVFREKSYQDKRRIVDAIVSIDNIDTSVIRPGLTARLEITTARLPQVLSIPLTSLQYDQQGPYVTTTENNKQFIEISHFTDNLAVVKSGLQLGDEVKL